MINDTIQHTGTVALHTLGCKLNFSETSTIGKQFLNEGYSIVDFDTHADVFVLNTCTVTENAEKECRQIVRRVLRNNPNAFVIVTGCYAQLRPEQIAEIEGVDLVLGSSEKFKIKEYIQDVHKKELACIFVSPFESLTDQFGVASSGEGDSRTRAYYKIQDGCDYKCSFCTIPKARGYSRSLDPDSVVSGFRSLVEQGYKEIILTGVNVGDYGKNFDTNLYELLKRIIEIPGEFRIRISSIEPNLLTDEIIELTASSPKLCNHFHIPLQSGSTKILKLMQRRYRAEDYRELIHRVKNHIPDAGIGVDVIVGFPGETDDDFMETYHLLEELPVSYLHAFTYSERPDTKAISMPDPVDVNKRRKRNALLRELSERKKENFYTSQIGALHEVLFEGESKSLDIRGFSSNYVRVSLPYDDQFSNTIVPIHITETDGTICFGAVSSPISEAM